MHYIKRKNIFIKRIDNIFDIPVYAEKIVNDRNVKKILKVVSKFYEISIDDIQGEKRLESIVKARHVAMYLIRELCKLSYPNIGRKFNNRHHTTIMHGYKKIKENVEKNNELHKEIITLITNLNFEIEYPLVENSI